MNLVLIAPKGLNNIMIDSSYKKYQPKVSKEIY